MASSYVNTDQDMRNVSYVNTDQDMRNVSNVSDPYTNPAFFFTLPKIVIFYITGKLLKKLVDWKGQNVKRRQINKRYL